jgi:hypothetical protein
MLIRCIHCFTPFTMTEEAMYAALDEVEAKGFKHYNAYCPRCGRPNMVARAQLEREAPGWTPRQGAVSGAATPAPSAPGSMPMRPPVVTTPPAAPKPAPTPGSGTMAGAAAAAKPKAAAAKPAAKKSAAKPKKAAAKKVPTKKAVKKASKAKTTKAKSIASKKGAKKKKK